MNRMMRWLAYGAVVIQPLGALAQDRAPTTPEILASVVRGAPDMIVEGSYVAQDHRQSGTLFVTMLLFEMAQSGASDDEVSLTAACEAEASPAGLWDCGVTLGIKWSEAESAYQATFQLEASGDDAACGTGFIDVVGDFDICRWVIRDNRVRIDLFG